MEGSRDRERKRNMDMRKTLRLIAPHTLQDQTYNPGTCPWLGIKSTTIRVQAGAVTTEHTGHGKIQLFLSGADSILRLLSDANSLRLIT